MASNSKSARKLRVVIENRNGLSKRLYIRRGGGFTTHIVSAKRALFSQSEVDRARKWAYHERKKSKIHSVKHKYPFIILDTDTEMVNADLAGKINSIGRVTKRMVWMGEGLRTYARQKELWDAYVARGYAPPLTARPGTSNHETGNAADVSVFVGGTDHGYVNFGNSERVRRLMGKKGLCLPVPGEPWHVEIDRGQGWRA